MAWKTVLSRILKWIEIVFAYAFVFGFPLMLFYPLIYSSTFSKDIHEMQAICEDKVIKGLRLTGDFDIRSSVWVPDDKNNRGARHSVREDITPDTMHGLKTSYIAVHVRLLNDKSKYWSGGCYSNHRGIEIRAGEWIDADSHQTIVETFIQ